MHEMALAESVRELVEQAARAQGATQVCAVRLEVGALAAVEVDALRFAFDVCKRGSLAAAARLDIVHTPGRAWCMRCADSVAITRRGQACPVCGSYQLQASSGDALRVLDIEVMTCA
jgi:hydrogenase nickel incorporation protein HypA/HybF